MLSSVGGEICLNCFLRPFSSMSLIYGFEPWIPCNCQSRKSIFETRLKKIYIQIIELFLWWQSIQRLTNITPGIEENSLCVGVYNVVKNPRIVKVAIAIFTCYVTFIFSFMFIFYPVVKKEEKFPGEALYCCMEITFIDRYIIGIYSNNLLLCAALFWFVGKMYTQSLQEASLIRRNDANLEYKLENLMMQHGNLWAFLLSVSVRGYDEGIKICHLIIEHYFHYHLYQLWLLTLFFCI